MSLEVASGPALADSPSEALLPAKSAPAWKSALGRFRKLPKWSYMAMISAALVAMIFAVYSLFSADPARLRIVCQNNFRSSDISVVVDGSVVYSGSVGGSAKKRFGIFDKTGASVAKIVGVPTGTHAVQVHLSAPADGFDQAKVSYASFSATSDNVLVITSTKRGGLNLAFQGGAAVKAPTLDPESKPFSKSAASVLFSVLGTMLSASISFMVQEFWRNHKQRLLKG
jgi:hypothetical protein